MVHERLVFYLHLELGFGEFEGKGREEAAEID